MCVNRDMKTTKKGKKEKVTLERSTYLLVRLSPGLSPNKSLDNSTH